MAKVNENTIVKLGGREGVQKIIDGIPSDEAAWYVHECSPITGKVGFYADKFYVGIHNPATHFKIEDLQEALSEMSH